MTKVCGSTMGHTYHWRTNLDIHKMLGHDIIDLAWDSYKKDVETLFELTKSESEKYIKDLEISDDVIFFNGSCESFIFEKNPKNENKEWSYDFCKANR